MHSGFTLSDAMDGSLRKLQTSPNLPLSHSDSETVPVPHDAANDNPKTATVTTQRSSKLALLTFFSLSEDQNKRQKLRRFVEMSVLFALVALVWGLLSLPTILYHIPVSSGDASPVTNVRFRVPGLL